MTLSAPVTITVGPPQPPTVTLPSPAPGATFTAPATITLSATASAAAGATISRVEFLQGSTIVGTATTSPYSFSWTSVAAGTYSVSARAVDSRGSFATTSPVSVVVAAAPALSISASAGLDGSSTTEDSILVAGSITAPPNSGVLINGFLATTSSNGQFSANGIPLVAGANNIALTVMTQDGDTATQSISVTSSGAAAPFDVIVDEPDGIAPHTVNITLANRAGLPFSTVEFDLDGDGTVDYTAQGLPSGPVQVVYSSAGIMKPRVTFKDASGSVVYATTRQVHVATRQDKYQIIKGAYSDMVNRLSAGTTSTAMNLFVDSARTVYQSVFDNIGNSAVPAAASQLGAVQSIAFSNSTAELILTRTVNGSLQTFQVHLIRGGDGIWRIESM